MDMDTDEIIKRIRYFRKKSNLSARELSLKINKSEAYICQIEHKIFNLSIAVLFDIIKALGISCAEFFFDNYTDYKIDRELLDLLNALPPEKGSLFVDLMKNMK